jgi:rod shape-determining protein MreD
MNWVHPAVLVLAAWLFAFGQAWFQGVRAVLGVQPDLMPGLVVYAALAARLPTTVAVAVVGGLGVDSLSSGPFGLGAVPLLVLGVLLHARRDLVLRDSAWAQALLGGAAAPLVLVMSAGLLLLSWPLVAGAGGEVPFWPETRTPGAGPPLLGIRLVLGTGVAAVCGAIATPLMFWAFGRLQMLLDYRPAADPALRANREIKRGRF